MPEWIDLAITLVIVWCIGCEIGFRLKAWLHD